MKVTLLDLTRQYKSIKEEIDSNINNVLSSQSFILGEEVDELEKKIANYCSTKFAIGVASGTDALMLSLRVLGIGEGDFVVTTPFTFFSTAGVIHNIGATPIFIDIKRDSYNIDQEKFKELLDGKSFHYSRLNIDTSRIKAIIPVHLYGQMADMDAIINIAKKYDIKVVEDACQAIGAEYNDKKAGSFGILGCFSFFPTKNLGGYGDGGVITTQDGILEGKLRKLRVHGRDKGYFHLMIGYNSRLDTLQAAVLLAKFSHLDDWNNRRYKNAGYYSNRLKNMPGIETPIEFDNRKHIYNQYTIRIKNDKRDNLQKFLKEKHVGTKVYYPLPLHLQECFSNLGYKRGDLPNSEEAAMEVLSLPIYPELTLDEIEYVCESIREFISE